MVEYINKAELIKEVERKLKLTSATTTKVIDSLPTIDIVHCSECRHAEELMTGKWCCDISSLCQRGTFFCADGERGDNNG